jgi:DNA invertase Pin-like site-specific DNA recombinase
MTQRAAVLYARISVSTEESVSVQRQIASARKYASARGWRVVGEFIDDGVSATHNKPEHRPGWRSLLGSPVPFDAVVVWKVDRLARRVIDFLHADETLQARGAAIVCVEQSIDMTTGEGRAFAQMLAVFGEMEASAISSRITAARAHLISQGRIPGGLQPYGWRSVPNPDGPGYVRGQDPERIEWVRGMAERVLRGDTVYSIQTWLNTVGAPAPRGRQPGRSWGYSSVDILMRNPVLAGMFPVNSRNARGREGPQVRRGEDGHPIVAADGIVTVEQYRAILHAITHKAHHSAGSKTSRRTTSPLLALLVTCSACERLMYRCRNVGKPSLFCRHCGQMVTMLPLADYVVRRLVNERGSQRMYRRTLDVPDDPGASRKLADIDHALRAAALALTEDRTEADTRNLSQEVARLKRTRLAARKKAGAEAVERMVYVGTVQQVWNLCVDDDQRHEVLAGQIATLMVSKAIADGQFHSSRVELTWSTNRKPVVPEAISVGPIHRRMRELHPWISLREASRLAGSSESLIKGGIKRGQITQRKVHRAHPSLERASVIAFLRDRRPTDC